MASNIFHKKSLDELKCKNSGIAEKQHNDISDNLEQQVSSPVMKLISIERNEVTKIYKADPKMYF